MIDFFTSLHFQSPQYLYALVILPLYAVFVWYAKNKGNTGFFVSVFDDLQKAQQSHFLFRFLPVIKHIAIVTILVLFIVTLARPQTTDVTKEHSKNGIDIIMALDVSESMQAEDLKPNRIEAAKHALRKFLATRDSDRVGIVVFAGVPFTQSPLTFDYSIIDYYLQNISTDSIDQSAYGASGTAIGDAILAAIQRLKGSEEKDAEQNQKRSKVIILLSDGDANVGIDPEIAAYKAKEEGIKIYTIGIGKEGGAPIPVVGPGGRKVYAQNPDGSIYKATFNEEALRKIASITQGSFFRVDDNQSFQQALEEINKLEKTDVQTSVKTTHQDAFIPFLIALYIAGLLLVMSIFITKPKQ